MEILRDENQNEQEQKIVETDEQRSERLRAKKLEFLKKLEQLKEEYGMDIAPEHRLVIISTEEYKI